MSDLIALVEEAKKPPQCKTLFHGSKNWKFYMDITITFESLNASCNSVGIISFNGRRVMMSQIMQS